MEIETLSFWRSHYLSGVPTIFLASYPWKLPWLSDSNGCPPSPLLFLYSCIDNDSYLALFSDLNGLLRPKLSGMPTGMHWPYIPVNNGVLNNNGFIPHSISPITTKRGRNVIQYTNVINTGPHGKHLWLYLQFY